MRNHSKKKKILILGATGMLGHKLYQSFKRRFEVWGTVRTSYKDYEKYNIFDSAHIIGGVDAFDFDKVTKAIATVQPDVVINCIGIIKQLKAAKDPVISLKINSLLPHQLANICVAAKARLFQISTDCVFNGNKGMYTEESISDAEDLYGRTKFLGEVNVRGCLTLRTSIIGRELATASGLVEWFLSNRNGKVKGFQKVIYTGFTTIASANIIADLIINHPNLDGLYQVSSEPIDKFSLLQLIKKAFNLSVEIEPESQMCIDRSLDSSRFRQETGFKPPSWEQMIADMAADVTPYDQWHSANNKT